jgi:hypothetical protein
VFCFLLSRLLRVSESSLSFCRSYSRTPSPVHHHPPTSSKSILLHRYSMNSSPGTSLVSGIQDISAFLPVIWTEQCERHVGEVLEVGLLYAAATPLSLFGSLGIVKSGTAILCAQCSALRDPISFCEHAGLPHQIPCLEFHVLILGHPSWLDLISGSLAEPSTQVTAIFVSL